MTFHFLCLPKIDTLIHLKKGGIETKPLFLCNHEKTSDCSNGVRKINRPLLPGWPTAEMICVWKGKPCSNFNADLIPKEHFCTTWSDVCGQIGYRTGEALDLMSHNRFV